MRLKLVFLTSLIGAVIGAGTSLVIGRFVTGFWGYALGFDRPWVVWIVITVCTAPIASAVIAGIFVYRHTARRRKIQVVLTVFLVLLLWWLALTAFAQLFPKPLPVY